MSSGEPGFEKVETQCDGLDNDCDLYADLLLPVQENACQTKLPGSCGHGFASCVAGKKICLAPPAVAESYDGQDNDCNGQIDDVPPAGLIHCRARLLIPPFLWQEEPTLAAEMALALDKVGIPFDQDPPGSDWTAAFADLSSYALVIIPGYLFSAALKPDQLAALRQFVEGGGVLIWTKILGGEEETSLLELAGVKSSQSSKQGAELQLQATAPGILYLNSYEERFITMADDPANIADEVFLYTMEPTSGARAFGRAMTASGQELGSAFVYRPFRKGAVYTLGHGLYAFDHARCYVNCFDPGADLLAMLFKGALREGCHGHYVVKHTVPGTEDTVLTISHDVDAPDSHNPGAWGEAGAIQMARVEQAQGVKGTNFVTTDYVAGYYNPDMIHGLCALGMCPEGGHSVQHLYMNKMSQGDCSVTMDSYDVQNPTVCGEVRVSLELLKQELPPQSLLRSWRTPYLDVPPDLFEVLHSQGVVYDSSVGLGDLRTHFPVALARFPRQQDWFRHLPMYEFSINLEDGIGSLNPDGSENRIELQQANLPQFISTWTYIMLQNKGNGGWNVLLVHPSYGRGVGKENLPIKLEAVDRMITAAKTHQVLIEPLTPLGDFWQGRDGVTLEVTYSDEQGYVGTLHTGDHAAPRFSLEFGDHLAQFSAPGAGAVTLVQNRVVFKEVLLPKKSFSFSATVKR